MKKIKLYKVESQIFLIKKNKDNNIIIKFDFNFIFSMKILFLF